MIWLHPLLGRLADLATDAFVRFREEEDGMTTTEVAVITFLLVGAAIVVLGIIYTAATNSANSIPVPTAPS
jgi:Flp pilus assembly pilin Flp